MRDGFKMVDGVLYAVSVLDYQYGVHHLVLDEDGAKSQGVPGDCQVT